MKSDEKRHISQEEVEHVAWLAHIDLAKKEKALFTEQLNRILDFFGDIDQAHTENVPPTYHVLDLVNIHRSDEAKESLSKGESLENAPRKEDSFFKSPKIV